MVKHTYKSYAREFKANYRGTKAFRNITRAQNRRARKQANILLKERIYNEDVDYVVILKACYN